MTVASLKLTPESVAPGQPVAVTPIGEQDAGTELRFYLASAPPSSTLATLSTYQDAGQTLAAIRLPTLANGGAAFTPDVPGRYTVAVREVTVYRFVPSYQGERPASGDPSQADNEEAAFTVNGVVTPQATTVTSADLWVRQTLRRPVGFGQETATLTVIVADDEILPSTEDLPTATLTAPTTASAPVQLATRDAVVRQAVLAVAASSATALTTHFALLEHLRTAFNRHIGFEGISVHGLADSTNALASTAAVSATTGSIQARLDDIVAKFNAHRIVAGGGPPWTHFVADLANVMVTMPCGNTDEAIAYAEHVYDVLYRHAIDNTVHFNNTDNFNGDGYFGWLAEPPTTLGEVAAQINGTAGTRWEHYGLTALYEAHRVRGLYEAHSVLRGLHPDDTNGVYTLDDSLPGMIATANALADALTRHVRNQTSTGAAADPPFHFVDGAQTRIPRTRATDPRSLAVLIEELWICLESHLWSGGPPTGYVDVLTAGARGQHPARVLGTAARRTSEGTRPSALVRLQKAFDRALSPDASPPADVGTMAGLLLSRAGFS
jgi:hypothetical protein